MYPNTETGIRELLQSWRSVVIVQMQPVTASEWDGLPRWTPEVIKPGLWAAFQLLKPQKR